MRLRHSTVGLSLVGAVVATALVSLVPAVPASAASAGFDPGRIVSDANFFDPEAMTVDEVQAFLDAKVSRCSTKAEEPCLKDWVGDVDAQPATAERCLKALPARTDPTAAQVIVAVATACSVSPRVLLVTLQKEQGLVTSRSPEITDYNAATGYSCPDTPSGCDPAYRGLANQVYWAARAFRAYAVNYNDQFGQYQPGTHDILYQSPLADPGQDCGTLAVDVENVATTALYTYTPYTPNAASLENPYRQGDDCSSYGNRNFWSYYNDWFGDSLAGDKLLVSGGRTYLTVGTGLTGETARYELPLGSANLADSLAPLGAAAEASDTYLSTLSPGGSLGAIVQDAAGGYFLLANAQRFSLDSCGTVTALGFSCAAATTLPDDVLSGIPLSVELAGRSQALVTTSEGQAYLLANGVRSEVADTSLVDQVTRSNTLALDSATLASIPHGAPLIDAGTVVTVRGSEQEVVIGSVASYRLAPGSRVASWWAGPTAELDTASVNRLAGLGDLAVSLPGITCGTGRYLSTASGLLSVTTADAAEFGQAFGFRELDAAACSALVPTGDIGTLLESDSRYYRVSDGTRTELSASQYTQAAKTEGPAVAVSPYFLAFLPEVG